MNLLMLNLLTMSAWCVLTLDFSADNLALGFLVGLFTALVSAPILGSPGYFRGFVPQLRSFIVKLPNAILLALFVLYELLLSSVFLVFDVLTPQHLSKPVILEVPLDAKTDHEITLLANLISLTPGTVSVDVEHERGVLLVHAMYAQDEAKVVRSIKLGLERRVMRLFR
jgi:multicomponent Na+:H+ antiporter subunit E